MRNMLRQYPPFVFCGILYALVLAWFMPIPAAAEGPMNRDQAIAFYTNLLQDARVAAYGSAGRAAIESALSSARNDWPPRAYDEGAEQDRPSTTPLPSGVGPSGSVQAQAPSGTAVCTWRQTGNCVPNGPREPENNASCSAEITSRRSGFCECASGQSIGFPCGHQSFTCNNVCASPSNSGGVIVAGPVLSVPLPTLTLEVSGATPLPVGTGTWTTRSGDDVRVRVRPTQSDRVFYDVGCASGVKVSIGGIEKQCRGEQALSGGDNTVAIQTEYVCNDCAARDVLITFFAQNSTHRVNRGIVLSISPQQPLPPPTPVSPEPPAVTIGNALIGMNEQTRFFWTASRNAEICTLFINGASRGQVACGGGNVEFSGVDISGGTPSRYFGNVRACNRQNNCRDSNQVLLEVRESVAPPRIPVITVSSPEIRPDQVALVNWGRVQNATTCTLYVNDRSGDASCDGGMFSFTGMGLAEAHGVAANLNNQPLIFRARLRACNDRGCADSNLAELTVRPAAVAPSSPASPAPSLILPAPPPASEAPTGQASMGPDAITPLTITNAVSLTWQLEPNVLVSAYYDCMDNAHLYVAGQAQTSAISCGEGNAVNLNGDRFLIDGTPRLNLIGANNSGASRATTIHITFRRGANVTPRRFPLTIHPAPQAAAITRTATLSVLVDESNPALREIPAGINNVELLRLRVFGTNEPVELRQLALRASEESNLDALVNRTVTIWNTGNLVGNGTFAQGNTTLATTRDVTIPQDGFVILTIKGSITPITLAGSPVRAGDIIQINYDGGRTGADGTWGVGQQSGSTLFSSSQNTVAPGVRVRVPTASERAATISGTPPGFLRRSAQGTTQALGLALTLLPPEIQGTANCAGEECRLTVRFPIDVWQLPGGGSSETTSVTPYFHVALNGRAVAVPFNISSVVSGSSAAPARMISVAIPFDTPDVSVATGMRVNAAITTSRDAVDFTGTGSLPFSNVSADISISNTVQSSVTSATEAQQQSIAFVPRTFTITTDPTLPFDLTGENINAPSQETRLGVEMRTYTVRLAPGDRKTVSLRWNAGGEGTCRLYSSQGLDARGLLVSNASYPLELIGLPLGATITYTIQCGTATDIRARSLIIRVEPPSQRRAEAPQATTQSGEPFPELLPPSPPPFPFCDPTIEDRCVLIGAPTTTLPSATPRTTGTTTRATSSLPVFQIREE